MKHLFFIFVFVAFGFTVYEPFVPVTVYSGNVITSSGTTEIELQFGDLPTSSAIKTMVYIQVASGNSGTIQFSVGKTIDATYQAYAAGSKIPINISNGYKNLRYKASASSQSFSITH